MREAFWKNYNYSGRAIRHQYKCPIRENGADLVTVEIYKNDIQFNAFEFTINETKKVIARAKADIEYVNKVWIVIPEEKETELLNRHAHEMKGIGVITVAESGKWTAVCLPNFKKEIKMSQDILKLILIS